MTENALRSLLSEMTLAEKIGELSQMPGEYYDRDVTATGENDTLSFPEEIVRHIGSALNVFTPELVLKVQKEHIENHPHHIPMLFMLDIIHGLHTTFPIPLAQACSFEPELVEKLSAAAAEEACVCGLHATFSPMVDLSRDARWGRVMESSGEDPYLNCIMSAAAVRGYQGDDLTSEGTISACVKHFSAYGAVEGGREYGTVDISERSLRQDYLPAYKAGCDAGAGMVMCAFNAIGGVPATADKHILRGILRDEWGYTGAVITDYGSLTNMRSHGISDDAEVLSQLALEAGVDIEMCVGRYAEGLPKLLESGKITMEQIDEGVYRVLNLKNRLGLFENPYRFTDPEKAKTVIRSEKMMSLAREAVPKCSVLLKNEDKILPLNKNQKIAFIGPFLTETDLLGAWSGLKTYTDPTLEQVLKERFPDSNFHYEKGCQMLGVEQPEIQFHGYGGYEDDPVQRRQKIARAVEVAQQAEVVVLLLGEHPGTGGELNSKAFIDIPTIQQELFRAVSQVNSHIVTVLFNHRPLDLRELSAGSKAILDVWFPGSQAANGIVDTLFGDVSPTGRLTMSFPYCVGQSPIYYNMLPTDHSAELLEHFVTGYVDCPLEPLYAFGEGLTYTDFSYGELTLDKEAIDGNDKIIASIDVTNTGEQTGTETVQLYLRDVYASVSRPIKELKGFQKITLEPGQTKTVQFTINANMCRFYNVNMEYVWEPGEICVFVGQDSRCKEYKSFNLI